MPRFHFKNLTHLILAIAFSVMASVARADANADLLLAAVNDNPGAIERLLGQGADPKARDARGYTALHLALRDGSFRAAAKLMEQPGVDIDSTSTAGETPLMMAALKGHVAWMQRLIDRGARLNLDGWTPLHYAATGPSTEAVAMLVARGARLDARSPNGSTALMMASRYGPESSVSLLLDKGADLSLRNEQNLGAADFARLGGRESLTRRLSEAGARR